MNALPPYRDLPVADEHGDYRHAWDHFPPDDNYGCLRNLTPEARLRGLATVTQGTVVCISLPLDQPDPPMFNREPLKHTIFAPARNSLDDRLDNFFPQASTQWDGFRHVRAREFGFFTGHQGDFAEKDDRLGIGHWSRTGIIGRGVLLDVSEKFRDMVRRGAEEEDCVIDADLLEAAATDAGVEVSRGDVLCVRTGWMEHYRSASPERRAELAGQRRWPGLAGSTQVAERLWDWGVAAVTADNPAVELGPGRPEYGSLHRRLIPLLGIPLGELFDFEDLAAGCARLGRAEFLFVGVPLYVPGGVGSPGNALAVL
jgi:kynurenine formamidase